MTPGSPNDVPALLGGLPVRPQGPPPWPLPDPALAGAVQELFRDSSWGKYHGSYCPRLEEALHALLGVDHALLCGSGTYAVELALRAVAVRPGDEVVLAAYDYPGNFLTIHALGAMPVLADVSPRHRQVDLASIDRVLGPKVKAVLVSHLHGGLVPMRELMEMARARGLPVIEDAAQCPGAYVDGKRAGTWGDAGTFSFGGSKLLSAGRGGALVTCDPAIAQRARTFQLRGNLVCPLSELQAAVLLPQIAELDRCNAQRKGTAQALLEALRRFPGIRALAETLPNDEPAYYKLGLRFSARDFGLTRERFTEAMRAEGIPLDAGFPAAQVGRSPRRYRAAASLVESEHAHRETLVLHHPMLLQGMEGVRQVIRAVEKIHGHRKTLEGIGDGSPENRGLPPSGR